VALHNALVGFREKNDEKGIANASNQLALTCIKCHDYDNALLHLERAEKICDKLDDPMSLVALSKQFIVVYTATKQYKQAIERCLGLLDYYKGNNDPKGSVEIIKRMAEVYQQSRDMDKAANAYETIASIHRNYKHHNIAAEYQKKADEIKSNGC
jgi:tetratricopeptide (TPR) repeat protein